MLSKEDLVDGREYLVSIGEHETKLLYYRSYNKGFYDSWQEFPMHKLDEATKIEKSPDYDKKILIDGCMGDPVVLYFDGYVSTKYGGYFRIKSVDIENKHVYLHGEDYDYSRISSSCPNDKDGQEAYKKHFEYEFERKGIRNGSVIKNPVSGHNIKVTAIRVPNLIQEFDFYIMGVNEEGITCSILYSYDLEVVSTPYSKEEEIEQIIDKNVKWDGLKNNKIDFVKDIIKYFEK
jgi:hypothetical protein